MLKFGEGPRPSSGILLLGTFLPFPYCAECQCRCLIMGNCATQLISRRERLLGLLVQLFWPIIFLHILNFWLYFFLPVLSGSNGRGVSRAVGGWGLDGGLEGWMGGGGHWGLDGGDSARLTPRSRSRLRPRVQLELEPVAKRRRARPLCPHTTALEWQV